MRVHRPCTTAVAAAPAMLDEDPRPGGPGPGGGAAGGGVEADSA
jgi:hypothetical protein